MLVRTGSFMFRPTYRAPYSPGHAGCLPETAKRLGNTARPCRPNDALYESSREPFRSLHSGAIFHSQKWDSRRLSNPSVSGIAQTTRIPPGTAHGIRRPTTADGNPAGGPSDVFSAGFVACEPENAIRPKIRALSHSLRNRRQKLPTPTEKTFCKSLRQIPETSGICSGFCIPTIRILRKSGEEPLRRSGPSIRTAGQKYPKR